MVMRAKEVPWDKPSQSEPSVNTGDLFWGPVRRQ